MMMPGLTEWLKQLITVLILVGFLEFLLPENELKGAVKLIMGVFIITLLIQPLGKILKMPGEFSTYNLPTFQQSPNKGPSTNHLIQQGLQMRTSWGKDINERNQLIIKEKLSAILGMIGNFKVNRCDVTFLEAEPTKVIIDATPKGWRRDPERQAELTRQIQDAVRLITNLTLKHIEVIWHEPK